MRGTGNFTYNLLKQLKEDVESDVLNLAPYRVALKCAHLEVSQDVWFKKTANQKQACIRKFRNANMSSTNESPPPDPRNSSSLNSSERQRIQISADFGV